MGRLTTTRGKKICGEFQKKSEAPVRTGFQVLRAFFDGVLEKVVCWGWFFDGEIVVRCVVIVVKKTVLFLRRKTCHILEIYFSGLSGGAARWVQG
jgi:hypothetical protein